MAPPPLPRQDLEQVCATVGPLWQQLAGGRLFLTGGTGFVGKWLMATLLHANETLRLNCRLSVLSRNPAAFAARHPELGNHPMVEWLQGDVSSFAYPSGPCSHIIHAAADVADPSSAAETFNTCVDGTRRVLDFMSHAQAGHFMLVSSGAVYGQQPPGLAAMPESFQGALDPLAEASAYGLGKRCAEWLTAAEARRSGARCTIARGFAFVGPYLPLDRQFAIGNFIGAVMNGQPVRVRGDGSAIRSYLYASDMAAWLWTILLAGKTATAYNVGGDMALSIGNLARRVVSATGAGVDVVLGATAQAGVAPQQYVPDVRKIRQELGVAARVGLDEGILKTMAWHGAMGTT